MELLLYLGGVDPAPWLAACALHLPAARVRIWSESDALQPQAPIDYALLWKPPPALFAACGSAHALFNLGAGVDALLDLNQRLPGILPAGVPLIRLDDAGMAQQMTDYVSHAVLHYFRRFDDYARQQRLHEWQMVEPHLRETFHIGVMGLGQLGSSVAQGLRALGFPLRGWSRSQKQLDGIRCHAGVGQFETFLDGCKVLVNLLPNTPQTRDILNRHTFARLATPAYLINVARGAHLVEADLLAAIAGGRIAGATLDVLRDEPLPAANPLWDEPRIRITPHISALTLPADSVAQIAQKIAALERGERVTGEVDPLRGY
jgi:glyoxylate/hydroxypyruvate reductase A